MAVNFSDVEILAYLQLSFDRLFIFSGLVSGSIRTSGVLLDKVTITYCVLNVFDAFAFKFIYSLSRLDYSH